MAFALPVVLLVFALLLSLWLSRPAPTWQLTLSVNKSENLDLFLLEDTVTEDSDGRAILRFGVTAPDTRKHELELTMLDDFGRAIESSTIFTIEERSARIDVPFRPGSLPESNSPQLNIEIREVGDGNSFYQVDGDLQLTRQDRSWDWWQILPPMISAIAGILGTLFGLADKLGDSKTFSSLVQWYTKTEDEEQPMIDTETTAKTSAPPPSAKIADPGDST